MMLMDFECLHSVVYSPSVLSDFD